MTQNNTDSTENQNNIVKKENQTAVETGAVFCPVELAGTQCNDESGKTEQKLTEILQNMNTETSQLNEAVTQESRIIEEVCLSLKEVLTKLHVSFTIPPQDIPSDRGTKKAVLDEECKLTFTYGNDEKQTAFLAEYSPHLVMTVLWDVIPELAKAVTIYRKRMSARTNFLTKVKQELRAAAKSITGVNDTPSKPHERPIDNIEKEPTKT